MHLTLQQATADPHLCKRLLDTPGQVWASLSLGRCSFLLSPGGHKVLSVPSKSLFPQSCVSSCGSMVGIMAISSKKVYAIPRSIATRAPAFLAGHCWPILLLVHSSIEETLKRSSGSASVGSLGPGAHKLCLSPPSVSGVYGLSF